MTILFSAGGFTFKADKILIEICDCSSMWVASFMTSQLCKCKCRSTFCHMTIGYSLCSCLEDFFVQSLQVFTMQLSANTKLTFNRFSASFFFQLHLSMLCKCRGCHIEKNRRKHRDIV